MFRWIVLCVIFLYFVKTKNPAFKFDYYLESLSPDCRQFSIAELGYLTDNPGYEELVDINVIPSGSSSERQIEDRYKYLCKRGESECIGNQILTMAFNLFDKHKALKFLVCFQTYYEDNLSYALDHCLEPDDQAYISHHFNDYKYNELQHEMYLQTKILQPPLVYVPWIVIDGNHDKDILSYSLLPYLCKMRKDKHELAVCK